MPQINRRIPGLLLTGLLICFGHVAAQQNPSQQSERTQGAKPQSTQATPQQQQNNQFRDQLAQLETQVKDLQAAIDDLKSEQQATAATAKETRELVLDTGLAQKQDRADLDSLTKAVGRNDRGIDGLARQLNSMTRDLQRVKTKVGLF